MPGQAIPDVLPIYPVKEQVVFPYMVLPIFFNKDMAVIIEEAMLSEQLVGVVYCPKLNRICNFEDFPQVGTICKINQLVKFPNGGGKAILEGLKRFTLKKCEIQKIQIKGEIQSEVSKRLGNNQRADSLFRWPSGGWKNFTRTFHCSSYGA